MLMNPVDRSGGGHSRASKMVLYTLSAAVILLIVWAISAICGAFATVREISVVSLSDTMLYSDEDVIYAAELEVGMRRRDVNAASVAERIERRMPFIKHATIKKHLNGAIELYIECQTPRYSAEIAEQTFLMSENFVVLGYDTACDDVIPLGLPRVKRAVLGEQLELYEDEEYISELMKTLYASQLAEELASVDASDRYSIRILYGDSVTIKLGDMSDLEQKLELAARLLSDSSITAIDQLTIDVSNLSCPTVRRS